MGLKARESLPARGTTATFEPRSKRLWGAVQGNGIETHSACLATRRALDLVAVFGVILVLSLSAGGAGLTRCAGAGPEVGCGIPGTGDCFEPGFTPYCEDLCGNVPCEGCCELVCAGDPFCCDQEIGSWDGFCANEAELLCGCVPGQDEPLNDDCENAMAIGLGDTPITNLCATIGGPGHSDPECNDGPGGLEGFGYDVWYTYESTFFGSLQISTCDQLDASWDSQIAVYEGCDCLALGDPPLACNQDGLECANGSSLLAVDVLHNTCYIIRIGSTFVGAFGSGILTLDEHPCPDFNGDGNVGPFDLATLLFFWGPCAGCPADVNGDGQVGPPDLAILLGAWGPCL